MLEKRRHPRVPLVATVEIVAGDTSIVAEARNLSISGMLIRSPRTFPEQTVAHLSFSLPGTPGKISVAGTILHVSPDAYMGVRFEELSPADRSTLERFVQQALGSA